MNTARAPAWRVLVDGRDLTERFRPRLLELTLTEARGKEADQLDLKIHDHDGALDERRRLVAINGASILYGAMREHLLTLSARHRHGPVLLPCLDFRGLAPRGAGVDP